MAALIAVVVSFSGVLRTRGNGTGAKRIMLENPERTEFIKTITGWPQVEPGTLTVDGASPLPLTVLQHIESLGEEPANLMPTINKRDQEIARLRGEPSYYGATVGAKGAAYIAVLSQQPRPAVKHRLEIVAPIFLRNELELIDGDRIELKIYDPIAWRGLQYGRQPV